MRTPGTTIEDSVASVVPAIGAGHSDDVVEVHAEEGYRLSVRFGDGTAGVVEMAGLIASADAGVFAALRDPARFAEAFVEMGAVVWPGDLDLAPDAM